MNDPIAPTPEVSESNYQSQPGPNSLPMAEPMPRWLATLSAHERFPSDEFFASRFVYYPGSGLDGQPVQHFASQRFAHCFMYVDYGLSQQRIDAALDAPPGTYLGGFRGYQRVTRFPLRESDLAPQGWRPHVTAARMRHRLDQIQPFGMVAVLERDADLGESHGPERLAILFLGADGIATYDALFCQPQVDRLPEFVVLQEHGFGGNYDRFGRGGLLDELVERTGRRPPWLYVADDCTRPWAGYARVEAAGTQVGGSGPHVRRLYKRQDVS